MEEVSFPTDFNTMDTAPPTHALLRCELFGLFVRTLFAWPTRPTPLEATQLVRTFLAALMLQATLNTLADAAAASTPAHTATTTATLASAPAAISVPAALSSPSPSHSSVFSPVPPERAAALLPLVQWTQAWLAERAGCMPTAQVLPERVHSELQAQCATFLRRCVYLRWLQASCEPGSTGASAGSSPSLPQLDGLDCDALLGMLGLPPLHCILDASVLSQEPTRRLLDGWLAQLLQQPKPAEPLLHVRHRFALPERALGSLALADVPALPPGTVPQLLPLPRTFQELVLQFVGVKCPVCKLVPKQGGMCLLCGALCCVASQCCTAHGKLGECAQVCM